MMRVPIFPLPETVFFPSADLPLHLFEPRYVQMGEHVIAGDGLLVVVLLQPGWEPDYYGTPPVHEIATLGRIERHKRLPEARINILLRGRERVRLLPPEGEEPAPGKLYRIRQIQPAPELGAEPSDEASAMADRLDALWRELGEKSGLPATEEGPRTSLPFSGVVNRIASLIDVPPAMKQRLLEQDDLLARGALLESYLEQTLRFFRNLARFRRFAPEDPRVN
jgi:Lon protease-like protein